MFDTLKTYWMSLLKQPRATIQEAMADLTKGTTFLLIILYGATLFVSAAISRDMGDTTPTLVILLLALIIGPIIGVIAWSLLFLFIFVGSRIFRGEGTLGETREATIWATIAYSSKWVLYIPALLIFREEMFLSKQPILESNVFVAFLFLVFLLLDIAFTIYFIIVLSKAIAEINQFSAWKGFGSILLIPGSFFLLLCVIAYGMNP